MTPPASDPLPRPDDHEVVPLDLALRWQMSYCTGSPVAVQMLEAVRADVSAGGALAELLPHEVVFSRLVGLRVMAAVHRLALERRAPRVALHLPTLGGTPPADVAATGFARDVVDALATHPEVLAASLDRIPQTNDPGRSALLRAAMSRLEPALRVRLRETGTSAGLNLRPDHLPGLPGLEAGLLPPVADRAGCDRDPVDIGSPEGRLLLSSYVWVDDVPRFAALAHAFDVAARVPAVVVTQDAVDFVAGLRPEPGTTTLVWHSAFWFYLDADQRRRLGGAIAQLGDAATPTAQVAHASWEWTSDHRSVERPFALVLRRWDGAGRRGEPVLLARGRSHGDAVVAGDSRPLPRDPLLD